MSIWQWLVQLLTGKRGSKEWSRSQSTSRDPQLTQRRTELQARVDELRKQLDSLQKDEDEWTQKARETEKDKDAVFYEGVKATDPREKLRCARRVKELDQMMRQYDRNAEVLAKRKADGAVVLRGLEAALAAPTAEETAWNEQEAKRLAEEDVAAQIALTDAHLGVTTAEETRLATASQELEDVQDILKLMEVSEAGEEKKTSTLERE